MIGRDVLLEALLPPVSILLLLVLALLLGRRRRLGRVLLLVAVAAFALGSLPGIGTLLTRPLAGAAATLGPGIDPGAATILVPTAGLYQDAGGRWWPTETSIRRAAAGLALRERLGLPLLLAGGNPNAGEPPEARVLAELLGLSEPGVRLELEARDSAETGAAVAALLEGGSKRVILVTSPAHVARMSAALRHNGLTVLAAPIGPPRPLLRADQWWPQARGLGLTRAALYEYLGILWYLVSGRIALEDLTP